MLNAKKEVHGVSHSHTHGGAIGLHSINLFISIPTKVIEPSEDLVGGLRQLIEVAFGEFAAQAHVADATTFKRARELAAKKKVDTEAEAATAEESLLLYAAMLNRAEAALGAESRDQKCLEFGWKPAFDGDKLKSIKSHDIIIEQAAVLYNLAAAWSVRASEPPLVDGDAIKAAAKYFQLSAGALMAAQQLQPETVLDDACPFELKDMALGAAQKLMLAQAQACFCQKAEKDGMGAGTQAKLCAGARDLYNLAYEALNGEIIKEEAKKMWGAGGKISHARSKQYEANARWHCASEAEASGKYGERQSQLGLCVTAAKVAAADLKEIKDLSDTACQPINSLLAKANEAYRVAVRDNETVYYEKAPIESELPTLIDKVLAKPAAVLQMVEERTLVPLPHSVRHPDEHDVSAGDELVSSLFARLDNGEFRKVPLSERHAAQKELERLKEKFGQPEDTTKGSDKSGGEKAGVSAILGGLFSGRGKDKEKDSSGEKDKDKDRSSDKKEKKGSSSSSSSSSDKDKEKKKSLVKKAAADDEAEDEALARALEASLRDLEDDSGGGGGGRTSPSRSSPPPPMPKSGSTSSSSASSRLADRKADLLARANASKPPPVPPPHPPPPSYSMPPPPPPPSMGGLPPPPSFEAAMALPDASAVEGKVSQLVSMGFPRMAAMDALRSSNFDVEQAAAKLLQ